MAEIQLRLILALTLIQMKIYLKKELNREKSYIIISKTYVNK